MIILSHPNIWVSYLLKNKTLIPSKEKKIIDDIICNEQIILAYHHTWFDYYYKSLLEFEDNTLDLEEAFNSLIMELYNDERLVSEVYLNINSDEELVNCYEKSNQINFFITNNVCDCSNFTDGIGTLILEKIQKPNKHWCYASLLSSNSTTEKRVDYNIFANNDQIEDFIQILLSIKNPVDQKIYILSDYLNFGRIFDKIKGRNITYCSSIFTHGSERKSRAELINDKQRVNFHFGTKASFKISQNKSILHPRFAIHSKVVISLTHDFSQIDVKNLNWQITFHFCMNTFSEKKQIISLYNCITN